MFEGIKGAVKDLIVRMGQEEQPLSLFSEAKAAAFSFDTVSAGWYARNGYYGIYSALSGGLPAWSGEPVSTETAMGLSTVWACNKVISESIGFLALNMMRQVGQEKQPAVGHPTYNAMKNAPSPEMTSQNFTELLSSHCVLQGNGFAKIVRRSGTGTAMEFYPIQPQMVFPDREKTGQKRLVYVVKENNQPDQTYTVQRDKPQDILHIRGLGWDGMRGYSVITMARQSLGTAIAQERNVANFYAKGGRVPYALKHPSKFKDDNDAERFSANWLKAYSDPHKPPILESGLEYVKLGLTAADSQLIESREFTIPEICRWFSVFPTLVGDLSHATFSNIESLAEQFVRFTLMTWLTRWEQEMWRCVLTPEEKGQGYFFRHDLSALLRADFQTRMAGYAQMLQMGKNSINEVRAMEGENPIDGGDEHYVQVNLAPVQNMQGANAPAVRIRVGSDKK
ncbi:phage portal protein [Occallatibacter riparius]|uniref:Phage portal protein n=1 Tax=Occallatibacter riparius TaxID=1002689 RepID=A0A9J7BP37_9BACT|nr:phage portal protein [Occallatibacter riparius]UWZ84644.1 phage portal protein [Occallatibacter riparius]